MSIEGLLLSALMFTALLIFVGAPLLNRRRFDTARAAQRQRERLSIYYERVLRNLHDLDEDYATGKLDASDYARERELWTQRGIAALKRIETLDAAHLLASASADEAQLDREIEAAIESTIAAQQS